MGWWAGTRWRALQRARSAGVLNDKYVVPFNMVLSVLSKGGQWELALKLLKELEESTNQQTRDANLQKGPFRDVDPRSKRLAVFLSPSLPACLPACLPGCLAVCTCSSHAYSLLCLLACCPSMFQ